MTSIVNTFISVDCNEPLKKRLQAVADRSNVSLSVVVRYCLSAGLPEAEKALAVLSPPGSETVSEKKTKRRAVV